MYDDSKMYSVGFSAVAVVVLAVSAAHAQPKKTSCKDKNGVVIPITGGQQCGDCGTKAGCTSCCAFFNTTPAAMKACRENPKNDCLKKPSKLCSFGGIAIPLGVTPTDGSVLNGDSAASLVACLFEFDGQRLIEFETAQR